MVRDPIERTSTMQRPRNPRAAARETLFKLGTLVLAVLFSLAQLGRPGTVFLEEWSWLIRPLLILMGLAGLACFLFVAFRMRRIPESDPPSRAEELVSRLQVKAWNPWPVPQQGSAGVARPFEQDVGVLQKDHADPALVLHGRLKSIDWYQLEKLVVAVFQGHGHSAMRRKADDASNPVDLVAERHGRRCLIQCCHWQAWPVRPDTVRELARARAAEGALDAALVAIPGFTPAARELAGQLRIELVDAEMLIHWIRELRFSKAWPTIQKALDSRDKTCPRCESPMVERVSRQGPVAGRSFWGCSRFPECRFTLES